MVNYKLVGDFEGETCFRRKEDFGMMCDGIMHHELVLGCTCNDANSPCDACLNNPLMCGKCGAVSKGFAEPESEGE